MTRFPRRRFLQAGLGGILAGTAVPDNSHADEKNEVYREPTRDVPIVRDVDVVVCGGGPAGIGAAIYAARSGAKTLLIENNGCLGGIWTAGLLGLLLDHRDKSGLLTEITEALSKRDAYRDKKFYDPETMKVVLDELCLTAGVEIMLHSRVVAARRNDRNRAELVVTESKSGRRAVRGKVFVDTTGDGDLSARLGCDFDYGRGEDGGFQPMSFIVLLTGLDGNAVSDCVSWERPGVPWAAPKLKFGDYVEKATGHRPTYGYSSLFPLRDDFFILMANHEYRLHGIDTEDVTKATIAARAELHRMIDGLRALGGPWKNVRICNSPEQIGIREARRIHGRYTISDDDIIEGRQAEDSVCICRFPVDVHSPDPEKSKGLDNQGRKAKPFGIPFRSLLAKDVDGLLLAGRCISGSFFAHSSYRVTGNAVPMGEAAGVAAALAASKNVLPHELVWNEIKAKLDERRKR